MKKLLVLMTALFVFGACTNTKKAEEEKKVEESIQKIDSIATDVQESTKELDETVKEVEDAVKDLDSI